MDKLSLHSFLANLSSEEIAQWGALGIILFSKLFEKIVGPFTRASTSQPN
jgi:hypothetical protein